MDYISRQSPKVIILTALAAEAKALAGRKKNTPKGDRLGTGRQDCLADEASIIKCGVGRDKMLAVAAPQLEKNAIVGNIGVSGGLAPELVPGTVILGDRIITAENYNTTYQDSYIPDSRLLEILELVLREYGLSYRRGPLLCTPQPLGQIAAKAAAYKETGALAVDMESAGAAEAARQARSPFFCIRVICDPAERKLERQLLAGVDDHGNNRPRRLLVPLLRRPLLVIPLLRMARDFSLALAGMKLVWTVTQGPLCRLCREQFIARDL